MDPASDMIVACRKKKLILHSTLMAFDFDVQCMGLPVKKLYKFSPFVLAPILKGMIAYAELTGHGPATPSISFHNIESTLHYDYHLCLASNHSSWSQPAVVKWSVVFVFLS